MCKAAFAGSSVERTAPRHSGRENEERASAGCEKDMGAEEGEELGRGVKRKWEDDHTGGEGR